MKKAFLIALIVGLTIQLTACYRFGRIEHFSPTQQTKQTKELNH